MADAVAVAAAAVAAIIGITSTKIANANNRLAPQAHSRRPHFAIHFI